MTNDSNIPLTDIADRNIRDNRVKNCSTIYYSQNDGYRKGWHANICGDIGCPKCPDNRAWGFVNNIKQFYPKGLNYEILENHTIKTPEDYDILIPKIDGYYRLEHGENGGSSIMGTFNEIVKLTPFDNDIKSYERECIVNGKPQKIKFDMGHVLWNDFDSTNPFFKIAKNYKYIGQQSTEDEKRDLVHYIQERYTHVKRIKHRKLKKNKTIRRLASIEEEIKAPIVNREAINNTINNIPKWLEDLTPILLSTSIQIMYRSLKNKEEKIYKEETDTLPKIKYVDISECTYNVAPEGEMPEDISLKEFVTRVSAEPSLIQYFHIVWHEYFGNGKQSLELLDALIEKYKEEELEELERDKKK